MPFWNDLMLAALLRAFVDMSIIRIIIEEKRKFGILD